MSEDTHTGLTQAKEENVNPVVRKPWPQRLFAAIQRIWSSTPSFQRLYRPLSVFSLGVLIGFAASFLYYHTIILPGLHVRLSVALDKQYQAEHNVTVLQQQLLDYTK